MYNIYTPPPGDYSIIYIYDTAVNYLGEIQTYSSLQMSRSLFGIGTFELHVPFGTADMEYLQRGNIISLGGSDSRCGIIGNRRLANTEDSRELVISGYMLKGIVHKRIIVPPTQTEDPEAYGWESAEGTAEEVLRHFFEISIVNPRNELRKLPGVVMDDLHDPPRGPELAWYALHKEKLADVMEDISSWEDTGFGWDVRLDIPNKRMVFVVIPKRDMTEGNHPNASAFTRENGTLGNYEYTENYRDYQNTIFIGGAGEYEDQFVLTVYIDESGNEAEGAVYEGWERSEAWIAAGNIDDPETLKIEGLHKKNKTKKLLRSFNGELYDTPGFRYGYDWDLGDVVTAIALENGVEIKIEAQVTRVDEVYERDGISYDITLGDEPPTLRSELELID